MLVQCDNCDVSFDHAIGRCLACGATYQPSGEKKLAVLARDAEAWIRNGVSNKEVFRRLTEDLGLSQSDVNRFLQNVHRVLSRESRQQGGHIFCSGLVLLGIALVVHVVSLGSVIATGCLALGGAMVALGGLKILTGWNLTA